jgi:hypothetical protein
MSSQTQAASLNPLNDNLYALLIGINCYLKNDLYGNLQGAVNDVNLIEEFLINKLKIADEKIWKLTSSNPNPHLYEPTEPPEQLPTYKNIVEHFQKITETAQKGDLVLVYYSGHGGRSKTQYGELKSDGGMDESIVPMDIGKLDDSGQPIGRYLLDVEITTLLKRMIDKGLVVTFISDSCHSGGTTKGTAQIRGGNKVDDTSRPESLVGSREELIANWNALTNGGMRGLSASLAPNSNDYVLLAACRPTESAIEDYFEIVEKDKRQKHGALTYSLLESFQQGFANLTYQNLHDRVRAKVRLKNPMQEPVLVGPGERQVFASHLAKVEHGVNVLSVDPTNNQIVINTGIAAGVRKGAKFAIYPGGTWDSSQIREQLAIAEVIDYGSTDAKCQLEILPDRRMVQPGDQAILLSPAPKLIRQVRLNLEGKALELIQNALPGNGWVKLAEDNEDLSNIDYFVTLNAQNEYEIQGNQVNTPYPNRPLVKVDEPDAGQKLVNRLVHLSKYRSIQDLKNSGSPLEANFKVRWFGKLQDYDPGADGLPNDLKPKDVESFDNPNEPAIKEGEWVFLEIINEHSSSLNVSILDLVPDWKVEQAWPEKEAFVEIASKDKGGNREVVAFHPTLPEGYQDGIEQIKVFATLGPLDMRFLQLPKLDNPIPTIPQGRNFKALGLDPLSDIVAAIAEEQAGSKDMNAVYSYREWVVKDLTLKIEK